MGQSGSIVLIAFFKPGSLSTIMGIFFFMIVGTAVLRKLKRVS
jgi:hypothetical protein